MLDGQAIFTNKKDLDDTAKLIVSKLLSDEDKDRYLELFEKLKQSGSKKDYTEMKDIFERNNVEICVLQNVLEFIIYKDSKLIEILKVIEG